MAARPAPRPRRRKAPAGAAAARAWTCCHGPRSTSPSSARRAQGPVAHQENQRRQPAPQLGDDPARDALRRSGHHRLEAFRVATNTENEKSGVKLTMLAFVIKAVVAALKKFPDFNACLGRRPAGLQAVLPHRLRGRHAQRPGGAGASRTPTRRAFCRSARKWANSRRRRATASSAPADMQGGSFSISSLGGIGGTAFTPIINAPEVAILGLSKSR